METRKERRAKKMLINGKSVNVHHFLKERAKILPRMKDAETNDYIDHAKNLCDVYDAMGKEGVNKYIAAVRAVTMRDTGTRWQKIKGKIKVLFLRIKGRIER